jgi:uncharacterized protein
VAGLSLASGTGAAYAFGVEPGWLSVRRLTVTLPRLPEAFHGYRIAHLSDVHVADGRSAGRLADVGAVVSGLAPDLVAFTGDFVTHHPEHVADALAAGLKAFSARDGVVAVLGNHDHWTDATLVRRVLADGGVHELQNDILPLRRGREVLHVAGVDDVWERQHRLDQVLQRLPSPGAGQPGREDGATVLLVHEPDFADTTSATGRIDLQLSGHSHGGQVSPPLIGPPLLPYLGRRYPRGLYTVGEMLQHTNPGLGTVRPHVRLNCRPEVTILTLHSP